ncbi:Putative uncharacterized protein [Staphylococcus xylosus]|uniref:DUF1381 domain-containing protein n=1 Tax=Staphylococcus xylosus TaxID=1288 RepID=UPI0004F848B2|nr:Putative uncharacterized protein [Staphylococcus xylosus]
MTNYLIKHTTHTTGETFTDVTKIRDNETYQVVEAESKEEALERYKFHCPKCGSKDTKIDELIEEYSKRKLGFGFKCNACGVYGIY